MLINIISRAIAIGIFLTGLVCLYPLTWFATQVWWAGLAVTELDLLRVALIAVLGIVLLGVSLWLYIRALDASGI
jgi:hypothetical protein